jgi:hypothetical protein
MVNSKGAEHACLNTLAFQVHRESEKATHTQSLEFKLDTSHIESGFNP